MDRRKFLRFALLGGALAATIESVAALPVVELNGHDSPAGDALVQKAWWRRRVYRRHWRRVYRRRWRRWHYY